MGPGIQAIVGENARLSIGEGTYVTANSMLHCSERIEIGCDSAISFGVVIMDSDAHHVIVGGNPRPAAAAVRIGDHVWVGARSTILKGVTIGDGAVVAAGAVVANDVPPKTIVGGTPAQIIREDVEWS